MTLQEFVKANDSKGFVDDHLKEMKYHIEMYVSSRETRSLNECREHLLRVDSSYYLLFGYIQAAFDFDGISFEDFCSLTDELQELCKLKNDKTLRKI